MYRQCKKNGIHYFALHKFQKFCETVQNAETHFFAFDDKFIFHEKQENHEKSWK
jgi:hypothetical protein